MSMPPATLSLNSPFIRCAMPQANSTTSIPRVSEPVASLKTLPCSAVISAASSSRCCSISSRKRNMMRARAGTGVCAQAGKAASAAAIAASVSGRSANGTRALTSPVAGLKTSPKRPLVPPTALPPMK